MATQSTVSPTFNLGMVKPAKKKKNAYRKLGYIPMPSGAIEAARESLSLTARPSRDFHQGILNIANRQSKPSGFPKLVQPQFAPDPTPGFPSVRRQDMPAGLPKLVQPQFAPPPTAPFPSSPSRQSGPMPDFVRAGIESLAPQALAMQTPPPAPRDTSPYGQLSVPIQPEMFNRYQGSLPDPSTIPNPAPPIQLGPPQPAEMPRPVKHPGLTWEQLTGTTEKPAEMPAAPLAPMQATSAGSRAVMATLPEAEQQQGWVGSPEWKARREARRAYRGGFGDYNTFADALRAQQSGAQVAQAPTAGATPSPTFNIGTPQNAVPKATARYEQAQLRQQRGMGPRAFATAQRNQQAQQTLMQRQLAMRDPRAFASLMAAREEAQAGRDIAGIRGGTERDVAGIGADVQREGFQSAEKIAGGDQDIRREGIQSGERTAIAQMGVTQSIAQLNAKTQLATKAIDEAVAAKGFASQEKISEARNKAETAISHARIAAENARARGDQEHAQKMFEQESALREKLAQLEQSGRETVAEIETRPQMAQVDLLKDPEYQQREGGFKAAELSGAGTPEARGYLSQVVGSPYQNSQGSIAEALPPKTNAERFPGGGFVSVNEFINKTRSMTPEESKRTFRALFNEGRIRRDEYDKAVSKKWNPLEGVFRSQIGLPTRAELEGLSGRIPTL